MKLNLETEILEVLRALTQLQEQYLDLVTKEEDGAADVLQDYRTLCERMVEWGEQLDPEIRAGLFGNRVLVKLVGVRPASLLQPALSVLATLANFREKDLEPHKGKILLRLGERLTSSLSWALESLQGSEDSRIYTMSESRSIFEKSAKILQFLCDKDSNLTRHIIRKQEYIKESLQIFMNRFKNKTFRDLYENLESEEEYMRDEERKLIAVIKIQSTVRMWRQKKLWRKLRNGMIACQRLYRRRREISESNLTTTPEQSFKKELTRISLRKQGLEYKYRFLDSCAVIGGTADPVLDECAGELENSCNSFVREDCTYKGEEKFNNTVTDAHACQELLQILGGVYGAEYFVYDATTTDCIFYSTTASECDGYSGPTRPDIDDCAGEGTTAASTTTTTDGPTDATTDSPTDLS
ncbi:uncharacterized protein LOC111708219 isoform X3 [Eurytemora carolleeae]|uniref:uncharacterized protein LOC111708219 isoform X3 n=1 Tax=Eurytemora carolleeae TaxID=1294199 RepID=UPI000C77BFFF|nr:uncharacterized protein LOC111708219 isoform X3 [Eurytemora carolleeae]|eukprot:XP_023337312.1 uncharacterized protein LOC111708219 isoform X3 [Eurytemora affinis]